MKTYVLSFCLLVMAAGATAQETLVAANKCYEEKNYACALEQYKKSLDAKAFQEKDRATILFRIGYSSSETKKREDALSYFQQAIAINPNYSDAYWSMAGNYYNMGKFDKGAESYSKAISLLQNNKNDLKTLYYWRSRCYSSQAKYDKALTDLESAIAIDSSAASYFVEAGDASFNIEEYEDAITYYNKSIQLGDESKIVISDRYYWLGQSYFNLEEFDEALSAYKKSIEFDPGNDMAHWGMGGAYYNLEEWNDAVAAYTITLPFYKTDTTSQKSLYYYRGRSYVGLKQYDKALADYDAILKIDPAYREAAWQKASTYVKMKKYKEAITFYTKTIELFKGQKANLDDIYYFRGYSYLQLKDTVNAKSDFLQSLALNNKLREPNIQMGHISYAAKKYYEAKDYYSTGSAGFVADSAELATIFFRKGMSNILAGDTYFYTGKDDLLKSLKYDSTNKEAHRYMADAYYRQSNFSSAEMELTKCIRLYKNDKDSLPVMYIYRANARSQLKNYKGTLEDYEQSDKLKKIILPDNVNAMAQFAYEIKAFDKAITYFTRVIPLYKADQKNELMFAYYGRGRAELELKQKAKAVADLKKSLELTPGNKEIQDWLTKAEAL